MPYIDFCQENFAEAKPKKEAITDILKKYGEKIK